MSEAIVSVAGLVKHFALPLDWRHPRTHDVVHAVDGVNLAVVRGEVLAIVGESGSGKTTLANCIAGFLAPTRGSIRVDGRLVVDTAGRGRRIDRRQLAPLVQMVFQDPSSALNPRQRVGDTLAEPLRSRAGLDRRAAEGRAEELLDLTSLPASTAGRYPHQLNSGQRQRVVIARALALEPKILIADEPVSKLDVSMQSQIINLLLDLRGRLGLTVVFITHDLSVVRQIADRVMVMYLGRVMEVTAADDFFARPTHPYSEALLASAPRFHAQIERPPIEGEIPSPIHPPSGCPFETRCPLATAECRAAMPALREVETDHLVACIKR